MANDPDALNHSCSITGKHEIVRSHCDIALVIRGDDLSKGMSSYLSRLVQMRENIELLRHTEIRKMTGNKMLEALELENTKTHERRVVETPAIFSMMQNHAHLGFSR
jgi:thioredoxin reductase